MKQEKTLKQGTDIKETATSGITLKENIRTTEEIISRFLSIIQFNSLKFLDSKLQKAQSRVINI